MKEITINVTCKYDVEITTEVPDEIYAELCDIYDNRRGTVSGGDFHNAGALNWLADNIKESDAMGWEYELNDLQDDQD